MTAKQVLYTQIHLQFPKYPGLGSNFSLILWGRKLDDFLGQCVTYLLYVLIPEVVTCDLTPRL